MFESVFLSLTSKAYQVKDALARLRKNIYAINIFASSGVSQVFTTTM